MEDILRIIFRILYYIFIWIFIDFIFGMIFGGNRRSNRKRQEQDDYYNQSSSNNSNNANYNQSGQNEWYNNQEQFTSVDPLLEHYKTLGLTEKATDDEIKKKYRMLAKKYHPDKNSGSKAQEEMAKINNAYDAIMASRKIKH
ncbi:hypothetical protein SHELI_v1c07970 [Spiroplasma helicoides]|uniref:J domain-containing protein n=1 Tax=Spiroplasma helicoides TaxID=216938 RepID=A0A1B3SLC9_9MOLU|nr:DnaJ domain-containing protein [Spiroplasma helicoides]AOG60746.1 hypothetical protein SHELI_v1c07970 [Spiroplasma helicoides]